MTNKIETKILNADFIKGYKQELLKKFEKVNFNYEDKYVYIIYFTTSKIIIFQKISKEYFII
jgi:hypothetical protein